MKTKQEIFVQVRTLLGEQFQIPPDAVTSNADLYDDLKLDSLDTIDLMIGVEKFLGRRLGNHELVDARTVGAVVDEIHALQAKAA
jgi:acyl carrier protein